MPVARRKGTAVIAMKVYSAGLLVQPGSPSCAAEALRYTLELPGVACATIGCRTIAEVEENAAIVRGFHPLPDSRRAELEALHRHKRWIRYKKGH